jgi:hypothetical protein
MNSIFPYNFALWIFENPILLADLAEKFCYEFETLLNIEIQYTIYKKLKKYLATRIKHLALNYFW